MVESYGKTADGWPGALPRPTSLRVSPQICTRCELCGLPTDGRAVVVTAESLEAMRGCPSRAVVWVEEGAVHERARC